jgi:hypothetical protein
MVVKGKIPMIIRKQLVKIVLESNTFRYMFVGMILLVIFTVGYFWGISFEKESPDVSDSIRIFGETVWYFLLMVPGIGGGILLAIGLGKCFLFDER